MHFRSFVGMIYALIYNEMCVFKIFQMIMRAAVAYNIRPFLVLSKIFGKKFGNNTYKNGFIHRILKKYLVLFSHQQMLHKGVDALTCSQKMIEILSDTFETLSSFQNCCSIFVNWTLNVHITHLFNGHIWTTHQIWTHTMMEWCINIQSNTLYYIVII